MLTTFLLFILPVLYIHNRKDEHVRLRYYLLSFVMLTLVVYSLVALDVFDVLYDKLSARGLTGRGDLFSVAWNAVQKEPFGYGYNEGEILLAHGAFTATAQNMPLTVAMRGGYAALFLYACLIAYTFFQFLTDEEKAHDPTYQTAFILFVTVFADGLVRSYSLGGMGLMPFVFTVSIGILTTGYRSQASQRAGGPQWRAPLSR